MNVYIATVSINDMDTLKTVHHNANAKDYDFIYLNRT